MPEKTRSSSCLSCCPVGVVSIAPIPDPNRPPPGNAYGERKRGQGDGIRGQVPVYRKLLKSIWDEMLMWAFLVTGVARDAVVFDGRVWFMKKVC